MNHAITIGGLLLTVGAFIGLLMAGFGGIIILANGMSDNTSDNSSGAGCVPLIAGIALTIGCIVGLVL